jgi:hypothetical protein
VSLIRKSDVKNHLSTRTGSTTVFPFGEPKPKSAASTSKFPDAKADSLDIGSSRPLSPEAVPGTQSESSVGLPVNPERPGESQW